MSVNRHSAYRWGMGAVVRDAGGSLGQSGSSVNWETLIHGAAQRLRDNSPHVGLIRPIQPSAVDEMNAR